MALLWDMESTHCRSDCGVTGLNLPIDQSVIGLPCNDLHQTDVIEVDLSVAKVSGAWVRLAAARQPFSSAPSSPLSTRGVSCRASDAPSLLSPETQLMMRSFNSGHCPEVRGPRGRRARWIQLIDTKLGVLTAAPVHVRMTSRVQTRNMSDPSLNAATRGEASIVNERIFRPRWCCF